MNNITAELHAFAKELGIEATDINPRAERAVGRATDRLHDAAVSSVPVASGELRNSIRKDTEGLARRVGSPLVQGFMQEYGTSKHPPQSWLMVHADSAETWLHAELLKELWEGK